MPNSVSLDNGSSFSMEIASLNPLQAICTTVLLSAVFWLLEPRVEPALLLRL